MPTRPLHPHLLHALLVIAASTHAAAAAVVELKRTELCNLFEVGAPVQMAALLKAFPVGTGEARIELVDFFRTSITRTVPINVASTDSFVHALDLGPLEPGYYDVTATVVVTGADGRTGEATSDTMSLGVVTFVDRTASQARQAKSRFGLKLFQIGEPGVWWRRPLIWDLDQVVAATAKLGLQWTRHSLNAGGDPEQPGIIGTLELIEKHPMNVILKIEGIPEEAYDAERYGPLADYKKKHGWRRTTVPLKDPYQAWLRQQLLAIPPEQDAFEIGNEVWNYMSGGEFAEWCQMVVEVVKETRPDAIIGADPGEVSRPEFSREFFAAGGMDGMNAIYVHPYTFKPEPETRTRMELRNQRDYVRMWTGKEMDLYVTEYGWPTVPEPHLHKVSQAVTEERQAQRTVRQSLMLYAEDMKTLIPHMMADREEVADDWDDWFGFFRLNGQPKPVVVAHAVSAQMFDSSRYVGEFRLGHRIGAMLFERGGIHTLALWCSEDRDRTVEVDVGVPTLTQVDLMGRHTSITTEDGRLTLALTPSVVYLVGVNPDLAATAIGPEAPLDPDWWWTRAGEHALPRLMQAPVIDGALAEWTASPALVSAGADTITDRGAECTIWMAWDEHHLYLAAAVRDDVVSTAPGRPERGDALRVSLGLEPGRQTDMASKALYDHHLLLSPATDTEPAMYAVRHPVWDEISGTARESASGIAIASQRTGDGWTIEVAIPHTTLKGFPTAAVGTRLSGAIQLRDLDGAGKPAVKQILGAEKTPAIWPYLRFAPANPTP